MKIEFGEDVKKLKYFTKKDKKTWFTQKNKDSILESFYVTLIPGGLVMSGDYDGVIVMPYTTSNEETISWMSSATTLSYFAEKVRLGNQHHQDKEYNEEHAKSEIIDEIIQKFDISGMEEWFKSIFEIGTFAPDMLKSKLVELEETTEEKFNRICNVLGVALDGSYENECTFWELCQQLESECDFCDLWELRPKVYTNQLKWQHQCLLWWANNIRDKQDKEYFEV